MFSWRSRSVQDKGRHKMHCDHSRITLLIVPNGVFGFCVTAIFAWILEQNKSKRNSKRFGVLIFFIKRKKEEWKWWKSCKQQNFILCWKERDISNVEMYLLKENLKLSFPRLRAARNWEGNPSPTEEIRSSSKFFRNQTFFFSFLFKKKLVLRGPGTYSSTTHDLFISFTWL